MAAENEQLSLQDRLNSLRIELDGKIEKKTPETTFWTVITIIAAVLIGGVVWFTTMNERLVRVETKMEVSQQQQVDRQPMGKK